jgi:IclR family acetate operon transcriptional repressor
LVSLDKSDSKKASPNYSVTAVDRAVGLLDLFADGPLSLSEVASRAGLSQATTLRYLFTLARHDFVERDDHSGRYQLGVHLFRLGQLALAHRDPRKVALPFMERLLDRFGETVNLALRNRDDLILIDVLESEKAIKKGASVGDHDLWHCSALGKAILAHMPEAQAREILERVGMERLTANTIVSLEELVVQLGDVRRIGYATDEEEAEIGLRCVAAPIFEHDEAPRYAISVSGPAARLPLKLLGTVGREVRDVAVELSTRLGYTPRAGAA